LTVPSERTLFQQVVAKAAPPATRQEAVRELGQMGAVEQLGTLAQTNGIDGPFRRTAVSELKELGAKEALETISESRLVDPAIREQAQQ
jgi:HEAT repeat protein